MWSFLSFLLQVFLFAIFAFIIALFTTVLYRKWFPIPPCAKCSERDRAERMQKAMEPKANATTRPRIIEESDVDD